ncbi:MAG TPA: AmmeMemoRadiSam system protein A [Thermodesulfovibrionales bacterium]|nr:AmmeMemoRadiSam system protein A [Thermodesulfovibrionales bacterium]
MHPVVELAKKSIEEFLRSGKRISPPEDLSPELAARAGVFVSLKKRGNLRGCIGTFQPCTCSVAEEIIQNAIAAATQDPRFSAVTEDELGDISYSVDVLSPPEAIASIRDLDPKKYGVIVAQGMKRGLLLPDLEGVDTPEEQLRIAKTKAGIWSDDEVQMFRFVVTRYR